MVTTSRGSSEADHAPPTSSHRPHVIRKRKLQAHDVSAEPGGQAGRAGHTDTGYGGAVEDLDHIKAQLSALIRGL